MSFGSNREENKIIECKSVSKRNRTRLIMKWMEVEEDLKATNVKNYKRIAGDRAERRKVIKKTKSMPDCEAMENVAHIGHHFVTDRNVLTYLNHIG